jgi:hypothetical protein
LGIRIIIPLDLVRFVGLFFGLDDRTSFDVGIRSIRDITIHGQKVVAGHADDRGLTSCGFARNDLMCIHFPYVVDMSSKFLQSATHRVSIRIMAENIIDWRAIIHCRPEAKVEASSWIANNEL